MSSEIWKTVTEFPRYEVSNHGRIRIISSGLILNPWSAGRDGLLQIQFSQNGRRFARTVHHVVAKYFLDSYQEGYKVEHIDGDRKNNKATNLRMDFHHGVASPGIDRSGGRRLVSASVLSRFDI